MMKLLLSSHSLSDKDPKKVRMRRTVRQRREKPQERDKEGKKDDKFEREIKRVLIHLQKIYDPMRM